MFTIKFKVGNGMLEYQAPDMKTIHKFSAIYGGMPDVCDNCKGKNIFLSHKSPKENDFYTLKCKDCGAELQFHQKKAGGMYLKYGEKMEVYNADKSDNYSEEWKNAPASTPKDETPF